MRRTSPIATCAGSEPGCCSSRVSSSRISRSRTARSRSAPPSRPVSCESACATGAPPSRRRSSTSAPWPGWGTSTRTKRSGGPASIRCGRPERWRRPSSARSTAESAARSRRGSPARARRCATTARPTARPARCRRSSRSTAGRASPAGAAERRSKRFAWVGAERGTAPPASGSSDGLTAKYTWLMAGRNYKTEAVVLRSSLVGAEAMLRLYTEQESNPRAFRALTRFLELLDEMEGEQTTRPALDPLALSFQLKLLWLSGYLPHLTSCAECGATEGLAGYSPKAGGAVCDACFDGAVALSPEGLRGIEALLQLPLAEATEAGLTDRSAREALGVVIGTHEFHGGFQLRTLRTA